MRVTVTIKGVSQVITGDTLEEVFETCGYAIESVIVLKNGEAILDTEVKEDDTIELIPVASGG